MYKLTFWLGASAAALVLTACGGGDPAPTGNNTAAPPAAVTTTITGNAVKGPVSGATVTLKNASTGAVLATTTTGANGAYSVDTSFSGDVVVEVSGGSYTDEASGRATTLSAPMRTVVTASGGAVVGMVTPLTTMAYTYSGSAAPNAAAFNTAAASIANQLGLTGTNILTSLPTVSGTVNDYGRSLRALSQYLQNNPAVSLGSLISTAMATNTFASFSASYGTAYNTINGRPITVSFTGGNTVTIAGAGTGTAGTARCGLAMSISGVNVANICYVGLLSAAECSASNSELAAAAAEQQAALPGSSFVFAPGCVANPTFTINLR